MKLKPVEIATAPKYPDKYNKEVRRALQSAKPYRWRGTSLAAVGLSTLVVLSLSGCTLGYTTDGLPIQSPTASVVIPGDMNQYVTLGTPVPSLTVPYGSMIPLFEYGEGTGAIGCVSIAAPVFMSEEEAFAILSAAFAEAGLTLSQEAKTLEGANLPITNIYESEDEERHYATAQEDIVPDGLLGDDLPVIFVSTADVASWHKDTGMMSSVSSYDVKKAAQTLAEANPNLVVFYDPIAQVDYEKLWALEREDGESDEAYYARRSAVEQEESNIARTESERLLRSQAEAFIAWLEDGGHR